MKNAGFWLSVLVLVIVLTLLQGCGGKTPEPEIKYVDRVVEVKLPATECIPPDINKSVAGKNDAETLLNEITELRLYRAMKK